MSIEANIDDQTGEELGYLMKKLMSEGSYDAFFTPIQMKKNRPAYKVTALCNPLDQEKITKLFLKYSSTLGVRYQTLNRTIMKRHFDSVKTEYGVVGIKIATYEEIKKYSPEYDDCEKIAKENQLSLAEVYQLVSNEWQKNKEEVI
ncbi:nickel insertion protein [Dellaglioa carnosa]|uniref:nickel insertion protein n=1 Tax=Dellaglioa carnosa TaxID=2995136 RepID=UPI0022A84B32|nr:nickel insertion protein [Dellaglioa carnosa]MCZ2493162.1 LarC family nickel insertion protein [Dellaglioa carnosa]